MLENTMPWNKVKGAIWLKPPRFLLYFQDIAGLKA